MTMTMRAYVLDLDHATEVHQVGRKAATLARLRRDGFPVPDGVVMVADALDEALGAAGLSGAATPQAVAGIEIPGQIADDLRQAVRRWGDAPLAVRSSGADEDLGSASYAGLYTTVLDVAGDAVLLDAVRRCWASAFDEPVRSYRDESGAPRLAVLIQPMVAADAAGVAFTADPVTGVRGDVVVEAVRGVAERLVSGASDPDEWVVRGDRAIRRAGAGEYAIDADAARAVAVLARRIERHQGGPQDIEWVRRDARILVLQARPITALPEPEPVPVPVAPPPGYWTREASHSPVPWTPFSRVLLESRTHAIRAMCTELGLLFETLDFRDIGGWEYYRVVPLGGKDRPAPPAWLTPLVFRLVPALRRRIRDSMTAAGADVRGRWVRRWYDEWHDEFAREIAMLRDMAVPGFSDDRLAAHLTDTLWLLHRGVEVHMKLHGAVEITLAELAFTCRDLLGWDDTRTFELLAGLSEKSTAPSRAISRLARLAGERPAMRQRLAERAPVEVVLAQDEHFAAGFAEFMRTHGCRALRYEVAEESLNERPDLVLGLVADQLAGGYDPERTEGALAARRERAAAGARRRLGSQEDRDRFDQVLDRAMAAYPVREDNEFSTVSAPLALVRRAALEIGRRLAAAGQIKGPEDVFYLEPDEVRAALLDGGDRRAAVSRARGEHAWVLAHPGPACYGRDPGPPPSFAALPPGARLANEGFLWTVDRILGQRPATGPGADGTVTGIPASAGSYTGPVRVVMNESEFDRLRSGDVLVCPVTSPVWSVLFGSIGALVTDVGGTLSHPAIIAREYGIPAVVSTGNGTSVLRDGEIVTVDGTAGQVRTVSR